MNAAFPIRQAADLARTKNDCTYAPMTQDNALFDQKRFQAKLDRANHMNDPDASFLQERAAEELTSRLAVTNRTFRRAADIFSMGDQMTTQLREAVPEMEIRQIRLRKPGEAYLRDGDLELEPHSLDLIVSVFGLQRCNDLPGMMVQIAAALKPDGLFMAAIPGDGTLAELRQSLIEVETRLAGGAALRIDPFAELQQIGTLLQRAGFTLPVVDQDQITLRYSALEGLLRDLRANGAGSAFAGSANALPRDSISALEEHYKKAFSDPDGKIRATANIIYMTSWTAHESQQKPLKPGSAQVSLSKILKP